MRLGKYLCSAVLLALPLTPSAQDLKLEYHGAGWMQVGKVENSYVIDITNNYNGNLMQNGGGLLSVAATLDKNWSAGFGVGVIEVHLARGSRDQASLWTPFWVPFVSEARVTYSTPVLDSGKFQLNLGSFSYNYNPDVKNLGLFLMRGYVYPGALVSGFGNVFGAQARYEHGGFSNDLILKSETDDKPLYDFSLADVASYRVVPGLELGAGVNFYRLLPNKDRLTNPDAVCPGGSYANASQCFIPDTLKSDTGIVRDASGNPVVDSITGSLAGIKVMGRFHIDPKELFGMTGVGSLKWGKADWVLYGEAAILGLKDYPVYYDNILRRIPVMVGFNFPAFGFLDYLSIETEYYASKNSMDNIAASYGSWLPKLTEDKSNKKRDDWKWSVQTAKSLFDHAQIMAQVANDHLRLGGTHDTPKGIPALSTPEDWYWTCKIAYFF